jgi:endonuclease/exonuclease/phosphatase family metal-dependent hydrolase
MPQAMVRVPGTRPIQVTSVHPQPPADEEDTAAWKQGLQNLPSTGGATIHLLVGDFNSTLDFSELRDVIARGYADAADQTGAGLIPTWHAGHVWPPWPVTIDHVLVDRRVAVDDVSVHDLPGSDHRAVFARLTLPAAP